MQHTFGRVEISVALLIDGQHIVFKMLYLIGLDGLVNSGGL